MSELLFARQAIVDARQRLHGYELLFRPIGTTSIDHMSLGVVVDAFFSLGVTETLGSTFGFLNFQRDMLLSEAVEVLQPHRFVLEILETVSADEILAERCRELRKLGFRIALDDYVVDDPRAELLPDVDLVKVDLLGVAREALRPLVKELETHNVTLLAEKVESEAEFERCKRLGFDLFQGYYFARPESLHGKRSDSGAADITHTLQLLNSDSDTDEVADWVKAHAEIATSLLSLVNSVGVGPTQKVSSVAHAINFLGRREIRRWLWILLFTRLDARRGRNPILWLAAVRGRTLELAAEELAGRGASAPDPGTAFTVGLLSVAYPLLADSVGELTERLVLGADAVDALTSREGPLGQMLGALEELDAGRVDEARAHAEQSGTTLEELSRASARADAWVGEALAGG